MDANSVNGSGKRPRSGAQTLLLLAAPLSLPILAALEDGLRQQSELRVLSGSPAQSTLRTQLNRLAKIGAIEVRRRNRFPGALEYELAPPGAELLTVATVLERWLDRQPDGKLVIGDRAAKAAVKALADSWSATMLRALAARPLSLTELDGLISGVNYPSLERKLAAMRLTGLVKVAPANGSTPYAVTRWLREGVGPLIVASRWEHRNLRSEARAQMARIDAEATLLLALPLLRLPDDVSGSCRFVVESANLDANPPATVTLAVEAGHVTSCACRPAEASAWATGSVGSWFGALIDADLEYLELGGDCQFARLVLDGLRMALFGSSHLSRRRQSLQQPRRPT